MKFAYQFYKIYLIMEMIIYVDDDDDDKWSRRCCNGIDRLSFIQCKMLCNENYIIVFYGFSVYVLLLFSVFFGYSFTFILINVCGDT